MNDEEIAKLHVAMSVVANALNEGRFDEVERRCAKVIDAHPDYGPPHFYLALLALRRNLKPLAAEHFRRVVELDPDVVQGHMALSQVLQDLGEFDGAIAAFRRVIELDPNSPLPYCGIAQCRRVTPEDSDLVQTLARMAAQSRMPVDARCRLEYALGKAHDDLGEFGEAIRHFDAANALARRLQFGDRRFDPVGTRKWLDHQAENFTESTFEACRSIASESHRPILVVGMIRSGTTLVEQILSSHPQIGAGGELHFWAQQERTRMQTALDLPLLAQMRDSYLAELEAVAPGKERVTDKMPLNYMSVGLIHALFPNARIIHCRRNPLDTCLSIWTTVFDRGAEFCFDRPSIVEGYRGYLRMMEHWRRVLPPGVMLETDYEDLVADRETTTRRMIAHCGPEWDDACLHHERNERTVSTPSRWQVRQPMYSSSVARWRRYEPWLGVFRELADAR